MTVVAEMPFLAQIPLMRALGVILIIGLAAGLAFQSVRLSRITSQNRELERQLAELQNRLTATEAAPKTPVASAAPEEDRSELLRLRNQAAQLRNVTNELEQLKAQVAQLRASNQQARSAPAPAATPLPTGQTQTTNIFPREAWAFAGYQTPENAFQSAVFAMSQGDYQTFLASMAPAEAARIKQSWEGKTPEQIAEDGRRDTANITSFQVLERREMSPDQTVLSVYATGQEKVQRVILQKVGDEWKLAGMGSAKRREAPPPPQ